MKKIFIALFFAISLMSMQTASSATLNLRNTFGGKASTNAGTTVGGFSKDKLMLGGLPTTTWVLKVSDYTKLMFDFTGTTSFLTLLDLGSKTLTFNSASFFTHLDKGTYTFIVNPSALKQPYSFSISSVPVPAAIWLFGSALVGLVGTARRKPRQAALAA